MYFPPLCMLSKNPQVDVAKALAHHEFKKNYDFDVLEQASLVNLTEQEAISPYLFTTPGMKDCRIPSA